MTPPLFALEGLKTHLLEQSRACRRPPVDRFAHPWLSPMPLSASGAAHLAFRAGEDKAKAHVPSLAQHHQGDGFSAGDYSLGLFHHDVSEAAIELLRYEEFHDVVAGSLLNLLDAASPDGCVHRAELPHKSREAEPAKPVMAQFALRVVQALGAAGPDWAARHRVFERTARFIGYLEKNHVGLHGLFLTHSSLQTGFDSDILSAGFADKTVEGPDTNAFMVLEYRALAALAGLLGDAPCEARLVEKAEVLRARIEQLLWFEDDSGGRYTALRWQHGVASLEAERVGRRLPDGRTEPYESWVSLLPLYANIPSPPRAAVLIRKLLHPGSYWGPQGVRTTPADDLYFHQAPRVLHFDFKKMGRGPVSNWSGPVWTLSNFYLARGLRQYGAVAAADELCRKTLRLLADGLAAQGMLHECYDDAGRGLWPRSGTFISWNVLALTLQRDAGA